jgi:sulfite reductase alpha subunit-like flavoprotein
MDGDNENCVPDTAYERRLTLLYATQTGNAQDLAESLARHAIRQRFITQCISLQDYNPVNTRLEYQTYSRLISPMIIVLFLLLVPPVTANILTR